jgi:tetratricopeptide (TPR) repeat protein
VQNQKIIDLISKNLFSEAKIECKNLLKIYPKNSDIFHLFGIIFLKEKNFKKAIDLINKSINLNKNNYSAFNNLSICHSNLGNHDESLKNYNKAIKLKPNYAEAYNNRGVVLKSLGRIDEAIKSYNKAIELKPNYVDTYYNKGVALQSIFEFKESLKNYNKAIKLKPNYAEAYNNRGVVLKSLGRIDEAIKSYNKAIELKLGYHDPINNLGFIFQLKNDYKKALMYFNKALELDPGSENKKFNIGLLNLKFKKFKEGWEGYELRKKIKDRDIKLKKYDFFKLPILDHLKNKNILIYAEQGLGDIIQFSRYIELLSKLNNKITFKVYPSLLRLFKNLNNYCELTILEVDPLKFDYVCSLLSLPIIFKTDYNNIPPVTQELLNIEKDKTSFWKNEIKSNNFKIGIAWRGNVENKLMFDKSLELKLFNNISNIKNIDLISLQKDFKPEIENTNKIIKINNFKNLDNSKNAFLDTVAIIKSLDLVISVDTSIAHLAGTLGKNTWLILKCDPDWRWFSDDNKTPWYPSISIFRQDRIGSWKNPFSQIESNLEKLIKK